MSFFYEHPAEYKAHLTREGELKPAERAWQTANNTYGFSDGLGTVEITIGLLIMADSARAFLEARPYAKLQTMTASKTSIAPAE